MYWAMAFGCVKPTDGKKSSPDELPCKQKHTVMESLLIAAAMQAFRACTSPTVNSSFNDIAGE